METVKSKKNLTGFFVILGLMWAASNFAHPVTPTIIKNLELPSYMFGVAFAGMSFTNFLFSPFWGKISQTFSSKKGMLIGCMGYGIGQLMFCYAQTELTIFIARCFSGAFVGAIMVCNLTYVCNVSSDENRGKSLAVSATVNSVAAAFGYLVGGLMGEVSITLTFWIQALTLMACGVLYCFTMDDDTPQVVEKKTLSTWVKEVNPLSTFIQARSFLTKTFVILFIVVFLANCGTNAYDQCFNYFIKDQFGFTSSYNGIIKAAVGVMALVSNMTICIWLIRKTDVRKSVAVVLAICSLTMFGVVMAQEVVLFIVINLLFYAVNAMYIPLLQDCVAKGSASGASNVMGFYNAMKSMGMIIGGLVAGFLYDSSPRFPFVLACGLFALAAIFEMVYMIKAKKQEPVR